MALKDVIAKRTETLTISIWLGDSYIKGVLQQGSVTSQSRELAVFPMNDRDLQAFPEGMYSTEDLKCYQVGAVNIPLKSTMVYTNGKTYEFVALSDRNKDGEFSWYVARKQSDNI